MPKKKRQSFLLICIIVSVMVWFGRMQNKTTNPTPKNTTPPSLSTIIKSDNTNLQKTVVTKSIFMPYWALGQDNLSMVPYDKVYYFGVSADENGVVKDDPGYKALESINCPNSQECILVLRMLDQSISEKILKNKEAQQKIIKEVLELTSTQFFSGVALDLEISGLVSDDTKGQINDFVQQFYTLTNEDYKTFSFIVYGDNYYRRRPYDMKFIGNHSDEIMIMAYDLSKSYGEPGPNFNFNQKEKYGYDFKQMVADFTSEVKKEKLTVIFGMYGYDWTLNAQGTPLKRGEAITINQIRKMTNDKTQNSIQIQSSNSKEKKIEYIDADNQKHIIWYEDEESAAIKTQYLKEQGIGNISFWAYGYF